MRQNEKIVMLGTLLAIGLIWQARRRQKSGCIIQIQQDEPAFLVFELGGHVGQAELHEMAEAVLSAFERFDTIDMLVLLPSFTGITPAAGFDIASWKAAIQSLGKVRRYAVVAPPKVADAMITFGDWLIPVEARTFSLDDAEEAKRWVIAGREVTSPPVLGQIQKSLSRRSIRHRSGAEPAR